MELVAFNDHQKQNKTVTIFGQFIEKKSREQLISDEKKIQE